MAEVYLSRDRLLNQTVAVKVLDRSGSIERFRREAQVVANLSHPNIIATYNWGEGAGTYFIVMEYIDGFTLSELLRRVGQLSASWAAEVGVAIASGLAFAHSNGVVHRDVKSDNVMIGGDEVNEVKVGDFGIARKRSRTLRRRRSFARRVTPTQVGNFADRLTRVGAIMGTAHYFSPEQARGEDPDSQSDVYSLGVVLYEMATGRVPFSGEFPALIALKHATIEPMAPRMLNTNLPERFEAVIMKAMAKHRGDRYRTAEALRKDLLPFVAAVPRYGRKKGRGGVSA